MMIMAMMTCKPNGNDGDGNDDDDSLRRNDDLHEGLVSMFLRVSGKANISI